MLSSRRQQHPRPELVDDAGSDVMAIGNYRIFVRNAAVVV